MAFEAYSVAVRLSLINHVSAGLAVISRGLHSTGQDAERLNRQLSSIGRQAAVGGVMFGGGLALAAMFKTPLDEAKKFQLEVERFRSLGMGDAVTADAVKFAKGMNSYGTSIRENLGLLRDAQTVFGDIHEAEMVTPLLAKMKFANAALYGDEGGGMKDKAFMDMLKVIEMRGGLASQEAFNAQANMVQRVQTATGGRVGANEYLNFIKTGGVAAKGMKDENFYYQMEPLIQEMGGHRVGTGLMSAYQNLVQGRTTARAATELMRIGLLDPKMVEYNKVGDVKQINPGALRGADLMVSSPMEWMQKVMLPAFASKGITDKQAILNEIGAIFTNRTASQLYSTMFLQQSQIEKNFKLNQGAAGIDELDQNAKKTLAGRQMALEARWHDLLLLLGDQILPLAITGVTRLNEAIVNLTKWMSDNPGKVKAFTYSLLGLSAFLMGGGLINMVIAAGRGFWILGGVLMRIGAVMMGPLVPLLARFGTYFVMFAVDFVRAIGMFLGSGFLRGVMMAFVAPLRLLATTLLMNPIGLVITAIAGAALLLWNNWAEVKNSLFKAWGAIKDGVTKLFKGDIGGAFRSFSYVFLLGWQTIFNTLIAGANKILPTSMQISKTSFADDYQRSGIKDGGGALVAPIPKKDFSKDPIIVHLNADGKKLAEVVVDRMARAASKPQAGVQGFDPSRSMLMPGTPSAAYPRG